MTASRPPLADRYELQERVAVGGQGEVWRAWDPRIRRPVAVKFLHAHLVPGEGRERFMREAEALGRLRHPAVVQLYDVVETDDAMALVMEYVPGAPLSDLLTPEGLDWPTCVQIGSALAGALGAAHREGVVHRDVKPGNVLIEPDGAVRLTDFGLARLVGEGRLSHTGAAMGTPGYWAPEQVLGLPITAQTDVYGLAALLYRAATGTEPVPAGEAGGGSPLEQVMMKVCDPTEVRADLPAAAAAVLRRGLEKDARDRHPDADSLGRDLLATLSHPVPAEAVSLAGRTPTDAGRDAPPAPTARDDGPTRALPPRRNRRAGLAIAAAAAALAGGVIGAVAGRDDAPGVGDRIETSTGAVALPAGWVSRPALPPTGLGLDDGVAGEPAAGPVGVSMVFGLIDPPPPRLFPPDFGARLWPPQVRPSTRDRVLVGGHPALRFRDLALDEAGVRRATLFMVPTDAGTLAIGCLAPSSETATPAHRACEGAAQSLHLADGVRPSGVGPDPATGRLIQDVAEKVASERDALFAALASAESGFAQERLLGPASRRIEAVGNRLLAVESNDPAEAARLRELRDAIRNYAGHLRRAGDAARAGDVAERDRRAGLAEQTERAILAEIGRLEELGYRVESPA